MAAMAASAMATLTICVAIWLSHAAGAVLGTACCGQHNKPRQCETETASNFVADLLHRAPLLYLQRHVRSF